MPPLKLHLSLHDWADVRDLARRERRKFGTGTLDEVLARALESHGLNDCDLRPSDGFGPSVLGAVRRDWPAIYTLADLPPEERRFIKAHELGHFLLHPDACLEMTALRFAGEDGLVEGYSPRAFVETQADVFAAEFLMPSDALATYLRFGARPSAIAEEAGLPLQLVLRQSVRALLGPQDVPSPAQIIELTASQHAAARQIRGHVLVEGMPGAGKTTACAAYVANCLAAGDAAGALAIAAPDARAARRLRTMIVGNEAGARPVWSGSLRSLAFEIVSVCPSRIARTVDFILLDDAGALRLVEAIVEKLDCDDHRLRATEALRLIKRCKKAGLSPADLDTLGSRLAQLKEIWRAYEEALDERNALDALGLVPAATAALGVLEVSHWIQRRFARLIVDDLEDATPAEYEMIKALAACGVIIFAAGDARAGIYRHQGARPHRLAAFATDFAGATRIELVAARRRADAISRALACLVEPLRPYEQQPKGRPLVMTVAAGPDEEIAAVAKRIAWLRSRGTAYRDQVVLARSHEAVKYAAATLEGLGLPVGHVGDLIGRREIDDLLAVLSFVVEDDATAFQRVAGFDIYIDASALASSIVARAQTTGLSLLACLCDRRLEPVLAQEAGAARLASDFADLDAQMGLWPILTSWLLDRSQYVHEILACGALGVSRLEAIGLLAEACDEQDRLGERTVADLRRRLTRLRSRDQETDQRSSRPDHDGTDRLQVMTIHAAKGRSFSAAHIIQVAESRLPMTSRRPIDPLSEIEIAGPREHEAAAEERALFAVALTRAFDHLHLSRALVYKKRKIGRSSLVDMLGETVTERRFPN